MIPGSVLISDAVFLELVDALNQYSDEEEEGHNDTSDGKQDDNKEDLPVTRKRKRHTLEGKYSFLKVAETGKKGEIEKTVDD